MLQAEMIGLPRRVKRMIWISIDVMLLLFSLWLSFSLRLGELYVPRDQVLNLFLVTPFLAAPIFYWQGLYRAIIRYIGLSLLWTLIKAVGLYSLAWGVFVLLSATPGVPRSVLIINFLVGLILIGSTRFMARLWATKYNKKNFADGAAKPVMIYGAGAAGVQVATALSHGTGFRPMGFIDDNPTLHGNLIEGLKVHSFGYLVRMIDSKEVNEVIMAMPSVPRSRRSEIIAKLEPYSVHVSTLPGLDDLASGRVKVDDVREVGVLDLLGRVPVDPDLVLLNANIKDRVVLVTGAGGSIGSELCRQIIRIGPSKLILYERSEHALYSIENELVELVGRHSSQEETESENVTPILASILNQERLEAVCETFGVQTIYHTAAYKHVPMVERNPSEAVLNNVIGTYKAAMAAIAAEVDSFVLISTDKAVRPTSTMGATKRFAEMILQGLATKTSGKTRFTMVRFGNVLDSSGSVVPRFREQIQRGGPVTVTDAKIIRYFMTIPEAAQLVIQAGAMGRGGDVFVLDMGEPVKILDMARRMIHLSGFEVKDENNPDGDIEIVFTGLRPGEKLYEELLIGDNVSPTQHPLIMTAHEESLGWNDIEAYIGKFEETVNTHDVERSRALLVEAVKGFAPQCDVADIVEERRAAAGERQDNVIRYPGSGGG